MAMTAVEVGLQLDPVDLVATVVASSVGHDPIDVLAPATWEQWMTDWLTGLQSNLPAAAAYELGLLLTDDNGIQQFNRDYRHQDKPTDVLSFATLEVEGAPSWAPDCPVYLGDIVISVETAHKQACDRHHALTYELAWLAAHGLLHLLGWDHPDDVQLEAMLLLQDKLLSSVSLFPSNQD